MEIKSNDDFIHEIIERLKLISQIQEEDKIDVHNMVIQKQSYLTSFYRTFFKDESRVRTLGFIKTTVNRAIKILNMPNKSKNELVDALYNSIKGLNNLRITYLTDSYFNSEVEFLVYVILTKINQVNSRKKF